MWSLYSIIEWYYAIELNLAENYILEKYFKDDDNDDRPFKFYSMSDDVNFKQLTNFKIIYDSHTSLYNMLFFIIGIIIFIVSALGIIPPYSIILLIIFMFYYNVSRFNQKIYKIKHKKDGKPIKANYIYPDY